MGLNEDLQRKLRKKFEPSSMISMRYKGNDLAIKTDVDGNAVVLFIGERKDENTIKGERYSRRLKLDEDGNVIKDHWERKGKA
jgi:hypothetical protein